MVAAIVSGTIRGLAERVEGILRRAIA